MDNDTLPIVNSHTEWDLLEEIIVGNPENAVFLLWDPVEQIIFSDAEKQKIAQSLPLDTPYPKEYIDAAKRDLAEFIHILEAEGVNVRLGDVVDNYKMPFSTPDWKVACGVSAMNPRDLFMVIGNEILETPGAARSRYFEARAYRRLFREYFNAGAKWSAAPRPLLLDELYDSDYGQNLAKQGQTYCLTNAEPVFDAADFVRCGRDIFGQLSHVTNQSGVDWLQRHLGDNYRIHLIRNRDPKALHIDTGFMPLAPGKVLVNPEFLDVGALPSILHSWEVLVAPQPVPYRTKPKVMSDWISINTLMLDEKRIVVERRQEPLITALKKWGFEPIPCSFENHYPFGGGFHCATLDVRRRGELQSYF
uniref:Glycine amidinotransferase n=1 Tax=Candidatus Kentrum sp. SD TaxID=2126332 RepID=A0A450YGQ0_9GAMM|nr:MAG: glycine amidinotransferase [Candidatus Kentron sp. SD]VFK46165.1 MAG: glycine amidinotransferase [Candidatus Kentron sp. SD]